MKNFLILIILSLILFSCSTHKLSKQDLLWQPYKVGDILIFESNKGKIDTIRIKSIDKQTNADDPLAIFPDRIQTLYVSGVYYHEPKTDIMGRIFNSSNCDILEMESNSTGTYISFVLNIENYELKYPTTVFKINKLEEISQGNKEKLIIEAKEYYDNMKYRAFDLRYIYWSKEFGYLGLEFKDNYIWSLKSFIRDGNEIYNITQSQ